MSLNYSKILAHNGDPVERKGCKNYGLGESFSNYAKFWAEYVLPNRDPSELSKLYVGFPIALERLFNNHYSVWYHLTLTYRQIAELSKPDSPIYVSDPLYHLASSIDLIERTFVFAFLEMYRLCGDKPQFGFTEEEARERISDFWGKKDFADRVEKFMTTLKPVNLTFLNVTNLFNKLVPETETKARKNFRKTADKLRHYRNVLTHSLTPLRYHIEGRVYLPKEKYLDKYSEGLWSSEYTVVNPDEYSCAEEMFRDFADELVGKSNNLWPILLETMRKIADTKEYRGKLKPLQNALPDFYTWEPSDDSYTFNDGTPEYQPPSGGTLEYQPPNDGTPEYRPPRDGTLEYRPSTRPSAQHYPSDSDNDDLP